MASYVPSTLEDLRAELLRTGGYETKSENRAAKRAKPGWWTTVRYAWAPFSVFPKCAIYETFGALDTEKWAHFCYSTICTAEKLGMNVLVEGWKNRENHKGPVVFLSNHMSTLETLILPPLILTYSPFNTVVKASLSRLPGLVRAAAHMGLVPIGRKSPREDLMTVFSEGCRRIAQGRSFLIFPQGSRERVFARKGYSSIGAKLAEKAGVPVIPIAVKTDCLPTRPDGKGWFKDFGTVDPSQDIKVACGPVLTGTAREMHAASFDWIKGKLDSWGLPTEG